MKGPVLGFRMWDVARPMVSVTDPGLRLAARGPVVPAASQLAQVPELDAWLAGHKPKARPRQLQVTPPDDEVGILYPVGYQRAATARLAWARPGPVRFECPNGHRQPRRECMCGLYAYLSVATVEKRQHGAVAGAIIAWGHIIVHGIEGFRAEHARIVALSPPPDPKVKGKWAKVAAERLGVPFVPLDRLEQVGREFGTPIRWEYRFE